MDLKVPSSDKAIEQNPYLLLGYGMYAYFEILKDLMWMFLFASLFTYPLALKYMTFGELKGTSSYLFTQYSLGNMGGSDVFCN